MEGQMYGRTNTDDIGECGEPDLCLKIAMQAGIKTNDATSAVPTRNKVSQL